MQSDIVITDNAITGTLLFVSDYTGFSGDPAEQSGNFIALHFECDEAEEIVVEVVNGTHGPVKLDEDGICIFRIADKDTQSIKATATKGAIKDVKTFDLTGLTCNAQ